MKGKKLNGDFSNNVSTSGTTRDRDSAIKRAKENKLEQESVKKHTENEPRMKNLKPIMALTRIHNLSVFMHGFTMCLGDSWPVSFSFSLRIKI